jgi:hypothetical protein
MYILRRLLGLEKLKRTVKHKRGWQAKERAERAMAEYQRVYRDWPPKLVDSFLEWERRRRYGVRAPYGYIAWKEGQTYAHYQADQYKDNVITEWR